MKKITFLLASLLSSAMFSQNMSNTQLHQLLRKEADSIVGTRSNYSEFIKHERSIICISDSIANRMRIISPITKVDQLSAQHIVASLAANFHTALDVKYAVSDGVMWSVFIHPLKELSVEQVKDALAQVHNANINFGTTYQSTQLIFGGKSKESTPVKKTASKSI